MVNLNLSYVDELINARVAQHGGGRGAPPIAGGVRIGASINRSVIVMLSALLQTYVEDVFHQSAKQVFPALAASDAVYQKYWSQMNRWGNPSDGNIENLFIRIGVPDVFDGLSWQKTSKATIKTKLNKLNQIRNDIAHGAAQIRVNGAAYSLSLQKAREFRDFAEAFGARFEAHVAAKL